MPPKMMPSPMPMTMRSGTAALCESPWPKNRTQDAVIDIPAQFQLS